MNGNSRAAQPWRPLALLTASVLLAAAACNGRTAAPQSTEENAKPEPPKENIFRDVTTESGVVHTYKNGEWLDPKKDHYAIPESLGGGGAAIDFDGDGLLDLFVCGGGYFDKTHSEFYPNGDKAPPDMSKMPGLHGH